MTGARSYTTKIWRQPSSIGFSSADALSTSMDPPGEPVISTQKRPCQKIQNGSEFPELVAQNFRNPQRVLWDENRPCKALLGLPRRPAKAWRVLRIGDLPGGVTYSICQLHRKFSAAPQNAAGFVTVYAKFLRDGNRRSGYRLQVGS